jgi:hypothetical protein
MTADLTPDQIEQLATEHAHLADTIAQATARQKEIKAILADLGTGKHEAGAFTVQVTIPQKFDAKAAEQAYPFDSNPQFYGVALDRKKLEHALPPATIDQFKVDGTPTVTVK